MRYLATTFAVLWATSGCSLDSTFRCASDESCAGAGPNGLCEPEGWCSYEDLECPMGRRYSALAGDGLGGVCVGEGLGTDTSPTTSSSTTSSSSGGTTTTGTSTSTSTSTTTTGPDENVPFGPWWDCDFSARVPVTVSGLEDGAGTFEDVVVLVALGAGRVDLGAFADEGADLRFVADDHATELPYEVELWDPAGVSYVWVRVPVVSPGERFFIYYDGPATPPASDPTETWPDTYAAVWHMNGGGDDSTSNANLAAGNVGFAPGHVGLGLQTFDFDSAAEYAVPNNGTLHNIFTAGATVSAWLRVSQAAVFGDQVIAEKSANSNGGDGWLLQIAGLDDSIELSRGFDSGRRRFDGGTIAPHGWVHVAVLYDDTGGQNAVAQMVIDGSEVQVTQQSVGNVTGLGIDDSSSILSLGRGLRGVIDEVRIRRGGTVEDAIVDYLSQSDQLLTYGPEDRSGCFGSPPD